VSDSGGGFCVDKYEESTSKQCTYSDPQNKQQTDGNLNLSDCLPVSVSGAIPWRNIAQSQAELACRRAGKRLPTNKEWYYASLGTPDKNSNWGANDCNVNNAGANGPDPAGSHSACVSPAGAYDMIGNVWEWVSETIYRGQYNGKELPGEGYVSSIDSDGMVLETDFNNPDAAFFNDYFWVNKEETRGIFRGGFWGNQSDAGQYAVNAIVPPSFVGNAVGFRCVKEANK